MNISTIVSMIKNDPKLTDDIPGFLREMNTQNIRRVDKQHTVIEDVVTMVSIAEMNGGIATAKDVQDALDLISQEPLVDEANTRLEKVLAAVRSKDVKDSSEIISKFGE